MNPPPPGDNIALRALGAWLAASIAAGALASLHPAAGLGAAGVGGLYFGLLAARRVQGRRVRIRRERRRAEGGP